MPKRNNADQPCKFCDDPKPFSPGESGEPVCKPCRAMRVSWESDPFNEFERYQK